MQTITATLDIYCYDIEKALLQIFNPLFSAVEHFKIRRQQYKVKDIKNYIEGISIKYREEMISELIDILPKDANFQSYKNFFEEIFKEERKDLKFREFFDELKDRVKFLSPEDKISLLYAALNDVEYSLEKIRDHISGEIENAENIEDFLIVDQTLRVSSLLAKKLKKDIKRARAVEKIKDEIILLQVLLLRLEALRRGKIKPKDLYGDIALVMDRISVSIPTRLEEYEKNIYEILSA